MTVPVAFYAPLKSPGHPSPSGDRTMARLLVAALRQAGFDPAIASEVRSFEPAGDLARQRAIRDVGRAEAASLVAAFRARPRFAQPRLWFTYHCYFKAPDWIGPAVADALRIPYVIAEGSRAGKRAGGAWAIGHEGSEAALDRADCIFAVTRHDSEALRRDRTARQAIVDLPPFLDLADWPRAPPKRPAKLPVRLLTVAMMRDGDKLASYRLLAEALRLADDRDDVPSWTLDIVGDGPARTQVEEAFAPFGTRARFRGAVADRADLGALYAASDLLVWPAVNEAYGMVLLEAQAMGCPVLAGRYGGVPSVVRDGVTGTLVSPGDPAAFADALTIGLSDPVRLRTMGEEAAAFVRRERHLGSAAKILRSEIGALLGADAAA